MSETTPTDPVRIAFEFQRTAVENGRDAFLQGADAGKQLSSALAEGLAAGQSAQREGVRLTNAAVEAYFDAIESATPGEEPDVEEFRAFFEENVDRMEELQAESWESTRAALEEGLEAAGTAADAYVEAVDASFDAYLEAHERVQAGATEAAETAADAVEIDVEAE